MYKPYSWTRFSNTLKKRFMNQQNVGAFLEEKKGFRLVMGEDGSV